MVFLLLNLQCMLLWNINIGHSTLDTNYKLSRTEQSSTYFNFWMGSFAVMVTVTFSLLVRITKISLSRRYKVFFACQKCQSFLGTTNVKIMCFTWAFNILVTSYPYCNAEKKLFFLLQTYAKQTFNPKLTDEAGNELIQSYVKMRQVRKNKFVNQWH